MIYHQIMKNFLLIYLLFLSPLYASSLEKDYYEILGVEKGASQEAIKKAYRKIIKENHPDLNKDQNAQQDAQQIIEAYEILGNTKERREYDQKHGFSSQSSKSQYSYQGSSQESASIDLIFAIMNNDIKTFNSLLKNPNIDINVTYEEYYRVETALMYALNYRRKDMFLALIKKGADINAKTNYGMTALMYAAERGNTEFAKILLAQKDLKPKTKGQKALIDAEVIREDIKIDEKSKEGRTALMYAAERGNAEVAELLIKNGAKVDEVDEKGRTALIITARYFGNKEVAKVLLKYGADTSIKDTSSGRTALMHAVEHSKSEFIETLLKYGDGADINAIENYPVDNIFSSLMGKELMGMIMPDAKKNYNGKTASEIIAFLDRWGTVTYSSKEDTDKAIDILFSHKKNRVLINAIQKNDTRMFNFAISRPKVSLNATNDNGETALMVAIQHGEKKIAEILIEKGADVDIVDNEGNTASQLAKENGYKELEKLLDKHSKNKVTAKKKKQRTTSKRKPRAKTSKCQAALDQNEKELK